MNKSFIITCALSALLVGCQTTSAPPTDNESTARVNNTASSEAIYGALMQEQSEQPSDIQEALPVFDDVWERIRFGLSINIPQNRAVVTERNYYARHQMYIDRIAERAEPYMYYIVEEVEKRDMPLEIALLPIVESAFDPYGYSHRSASGIWQFMPQTGLRFGLKQNWWYDGRRDIAESTRAALEYLTYLHDTLDGDWLNAIAAYNSGEGRVLRAIKKNKKKNLPTDFWSLDLPKETTAYVPKLLALADLLKNQDQFNIRWNKIVNAQVIDRVDIDTQIDLAVAADMAGISLSHLYQLNPAYNRWATDPQGPHHLLLPLDSIESFKLKLANAEINERLRWVQYKVKSGDSLSTIARKHSTDVQSIRTLNKLKNNTIRIGQTLMLPVSDNAPAHLPIDVRQAANQHASITKTYKVKPGDTLWDISRQNDVTVAQLRTWNNLSSNSVLHQGQTLKIRQSTQNKHVAALHKTITYKVRSGDSLSRIASQFNVRIEDIRKWNNLSGKKYLYPGQKLTLRINNKQS